MHQRPDGNSNTLFHDLFVIDSIPDVNVGFEWHMSNRWVEV
jgi:hypothetical protein